MKKLTISELEKLLNQEEEVPIQILSNGEIRAMKKTKLKKDELKPLTMKENLGGEYGRY